jgi:hypothetical protein
MKHMSEFNSNFEECCAILGISPILPDVSDLDPLIGRREIAGHKLDIIIKANNKDYKPNMADTKQKKWHPLFWVEKDDSKPAGFRLAFYVAFYYYDYTTLGARHACASEELGAFMGRNCTELYEDFKAV